MSATHEDDFAQYGLLDGLEGNSRQERTDLIAWLHAQGFTTDQIRLAAPTPLLLPTSRVLGDEGRYISLRELSTETGMDPELLTRLLDAAGLPRPEDPCNAELLRADGDAIARARHFIDMGVNPDETVAILRALTAGIGQATEMMRDFVLNMLLVPGGGGARSNSLTPSKSSHDERGQTCYPRLANFSS